MLEPGRPAPEWHPPHGPVFSYIVNYLGATYPYCTKSQRSTGTPVGFIDPKQCQYNFSVPSDVPLIKYDPFLLDDEHTQAYLYI